MSYGYKEKGGRKLTNFFSYIRSAAFWLSVFFLTLAITIACNIMAIFIRDKKKKEEFYRKGSRLWGQLLTHVSLVKVDVSGLEHIPAGTGIIFTPNHQSYLDIFILFKYLHMPFRFVIMRKLFKFPLLGSHIRKSGFISLDRKDRKKSVRTIHRIIDMLNSGESFVIFPEGRLTRDGKIGEFGRGASIIIQRSRKPVVPVAIDGTFNILPKGAWRLRGSNVSLKIGKPRYFENYYSEVNKGTSLRVGEELRNVIVELKGGN